MMGRLTAFTAMLGCLAGYHGIWEGSKAMLMDLVTSLLYGAGLHCRAMRQDHGPGDLSVRTSGPQMLVTVLGRKVRCDLGMV